MSSNVNTALSRNEWHLDLVYDLPSRSLQVDPSIDDPVDDTGFGRGAAICKLHASWFRS